MIVTKEGYVYQFDRYGKDIMHKDAPELQGLLDYLYPSMGMKLELITNTKGDYVFRIFKENREAEKFDFVLSRKGERLDKAIAIEKMCEVVDLCIGGNFAK